MTGWRLRGDAGVAAPALERVDFVRDQAANLAWAVERQALGPFKATDCSGFYGSVRQRR